MDQKGKWRRPLLMLAAEFLILALETVRELTTFVVTRYWISAKKWEAAEGKCRIVFLSDLHNRMYGKNNDRLFEAIARQKPDIILAGGDMLVGKNGHDYHPASEFVKRLPSICPVYYANGNHEQRMKEHPKDYEQSYKEYRAGLIKAGVHFLENTSAEFMCKDVSVRVTGLEIPDKGYAKVKRKGPDIKTVEACIGECDRKSYQILLAHNPAYMNIYLKWGADLVLSGHFHGGVVGIPGFRGVISPGFELFPKYSGGYYKKGTQAAVVSRGIGNHTIPVRLFNSAEIIVLEF
ncbi:metallophosphoesterase [Lachnospiraceae bacterium 42-17]|jgi:predicted MPP superfamily phosphohydrolase|nr:metallophosphoesterase [Dorea sp.]